MTELESLEQQLKNTKALVAKRDLALRLRQNPDFKTLIEDEYFVQEAARLVGESGNPAYTAEQRADMFGMAQAPGHLKRYLYVLGQMADQAEANIPEIEQAIQELRMEDTE